MKVKVSNRVSALNREWREAERVPHPICHRSPDMVIYYLFQGTGSVAKALVGRHSLRCSGVHARVWVWGGQAAGARVWNADGREPAPTTQRWDGGLGRGGWETAGSTTYARFSRSCLAPADQNSSLSKVTRSILLCFCKEARRRGPGSQAGVHGSAEMEAARPPGTRLGSHISSSQTLRLYLCTPLFLCRFSLSQFLNVLN